MRYLFVCDYIKNKIGREVIVGKTSFDVDAHSPCRKADIKLGKQRILYKRMKISTCY